MFPCRNCIDRFFRAAAGDGIQPLPRVRGRARISAPPRSFSVPPRRMITTVVARTTQSALQISPVDAESTKESDLSQLTSGKSPKEEISRAERRAIIEELRYLPDPLKLAEHVHYTLRRNMPEKALEMCRMASRDKEVIVSWNHCIDWLMSKGRVVQAMKVYNEMKKRAQHPDSYTSTLILRSLSGDQYMTTEETKRASVSRAISIYNSLSSPTSRVRPSIVHANATLMVCNKAGDMDALWSIVNQLPVTGERAPDHVTYAIILDALRYAALPEEDPEGIYEGRVQEQLTEAVQEGRKIWRKVVDRWKLGEIQVDEKLVVAMGGLLLESKRMEDWDDVFSLIKQMMNIDRQVPPIGDANRHLDHVPVEGEKLADEKTEGAVTEYKNTASARVFNPVDTLSLTSSTTSKNLRRTIPGYAEPGSATLSLALRAAGQFRAPKVASAYWTLLTKPVDKGGYAVKADLATFHNYLRLLRFNRSSARASSLVKHDVAAMGIVPIFTTFRLAMSVCQRDLKNPNVVANAHAIIEVMRQTCPDPDVGAAQQYLSLALATQNGPAIVSTLDHLDLMVHGMKSKLSFGLDPTDRGGVPSRERVVKDRAETIEFFQQIVGAIHVLMQRNMIPREDFSHWHGRRSLLTAFLGRQQALLTKQKEALGPDAQINKEVKKRWAPIKTYGTAPVIHRRLKALDGPPS